MSADVFKMTISDQASGEQTSSRAGKEFIAFKISIRSMFVPLTAGLHGPHVGDTANRRHSMTITECCSSLFL